MTGLLAESVVIKFLTPHPQDIPQNVASRPPVFLNQDWLARERPTASKLRMLEDELAFVKGRLKDQAIEIDKAWLSQHELASVGCMRRELKGKAKSPMKIS